jgi:hypothetical protein
MPGIEMDVYEYKMPPTPVACIVHFRENNSWFLSCPDHNLMQENPAATSNEEPGF